MFCISGSDTRCAGDVEDLEMSIISKTGFLFIEIHITYCTMGLYRNNWHAGKLLTNKYHRNCRCSDMVLLRDKQGVC